MRVCQFRGGDLSSFSPIRADPGLKLAMRENETDHVLIRNCPGTCSPNP